MAPSGTSATFLLKTFTHVSYFSIGSEETGSATQAAYTTIACTGSFAFLTPHNCYFLLFPELMAYSSLSESVKNASLTGKIQTNKQTRQAGKPHTMMRQFYFYIVSDYHACYRNKILPILLSYKWRFSLSRKTSVSCY